MSANATAIVPPKSRPIFAKKPPRFFDAIIWAFIIVGMLLLLGGSVFFVPRVRNSILRAAGSALVVNGRVQPVDVIVVMLDLDGAGVLEAADLSQTGVAKRVGVFADPPDSVDREFIRRGLPYEDGAARDVQQFRALGVQNVEEIPKKAANADEGAALANWCEKHKVRSVLVVTHSERSRRLGRVFRRAMKGHHTEVTILSTHYSEFDPNRWWQTHGGIRTEIEEFEKLLLDIACHPLS